MKKVILGKTKIETLNVGLGGIPLQRLNLEEAKQVVVYCLDKGVNYFDSARAYTVSEKLMGGAIKGRRNEVILASKAPAFTADDLFKFVEISLHEFGAECIDIYQVHNVPSKERIDAVFGFGGSYEGFLKLKEQSKLKHFGLTAHKREVLDYALDKYGDKIETIMFPYNIVENQGEQLFRKAKKLNIATIAMKPLAGGNVENAALAMRYCLDNDFIDIAIPGIGSVEEAKQDLNVKVGALTESEKQECEKIVKELGNDFCRRCSYCAPCAVGIDIAGVFTMANYVKKYDLKEWAKSRYDGFAKHAEDCVDCGICEQRCPYGLRIREKLRQAGKDLG